MLGFKAFALLGLSLVSTNAYVLNTTYDASNFFNDSSFSWYDGWDVFNKGLVNYLSKDKALAAGIVKVTPQNQVYLGVDYTTKLTSATPGPGNGRSSVRLLSNLAIDNGLIIADFAHLPANACGTWTAFWLVHDSGDGYNEIDIIENISLNNQNWMNAYTNVGTCTMTDLGGTGTNDGTNCLIAGGGCHVEAPVGTFGQSFNDQPGGGGFLAARFETDGIKIWQFPRNSAPADISSDTPDPTKWGKPVMNYQATGCDMKTIFHKMQLTINISMCGTFAAWAWSADKTCATVTGSSTCEAYVAANPAVFKDSYYLINSVKIFQNTTQRPPSATGSAAVKVAATTLATSTSSKASPSPSQVEDDSDCEL